MRKIESPKIEAASLVAGMIVNACGERFDITGVKVQPEYGSVVITNWQGESRGLSIAENVELLGYFNP